MYQILSKLNLFIRVKSVMKFFLNTFLLLLALNIFEKNAYSLSEYKIREMCQNKRKRSICLKNLRQKKIDLENGNTIEIPVIPYRK